MPEYQRSRRQVAVLGALVFASIVCTALIALRVMYSGTFMHVDMLWNLFLAWLPLLASLAAYNLARKRGRAGWPIVAGCALLWLLFFPNAPYIMTDLGNLRPRAGVPLWFDMLMFVAFAWTGTLLGLVSLYLMQSLVRRSKGAAFGWLFALAGVLLGSFGVYLGRFQRFNSWDVFVTPHTLVSDLLTKLQNPSAAVQMVAFSGVFALLLLSFYLIFVAVVGFEGHRAHVEQSWDH
jgi:uncharacterized membrane protein